MGQSQQNEYDPLAPLALYQKEKKYVYALTVALVSVLVCLLLISTVCVLLLRKMPKLNDNYRGITKWNNRRRKSVTMDGKLSPQHIAVNEKQHELELDSTRSNSFNKNDNDKVNMNNISGSSPVSLSPFKYYDGTIKSIVYDSIIQPYNMNEEMDAI